MEARERQCAVADQAYRRLLPGEEQLGEPHRLVGRDPVPVGLDGEQAGQLVAAGSAAPDSAGSITLAS